MIIDRPFFKHFIAEVECSFDESNSVNWINIKIDKLLEKLRISKLETMYHRFEPQGISIVNILSASHIAIHSWPENEYLHIDLISCADNTDFELFKKAISEVFIDYKSNTVNLDY